MLQCPALAIFRGPAIERLKGVKDVGVLRFCSLSQRGQSRLELSQGLFGRKGKSATAIFLTYDLYAWEALLNLFGAQRADGELEEQPFIKTADVLSYSRPGDVETALQHLRVSGHVRRQLDPWIPPGALFIDGLFPFDPEMGIGVGHFLHSG